MYRLIIVVFMALNLTACFIAPGQRMPAPPVSQESLVANQIKINFVPITVPLVQRLQHHDVINGIHNQNDIYHYRVGTYDVLNIYVWEHPEFTSALGSAPSEQGMNANINPSVSTNGFQVGSDGEIYYPLLGQIYVAGKTTDQIRSQLTQSLKKYIRNPQVDVRISGFRSKKIYVMGEVKNPGLQPLTDSPMSLTDAINLAGGMILDTADPSHIFVIRGDYGHPTVYWLNAQSPAALLLAENFKLQAHDVIFVSTAGVSLWNRAISQILPTLLTYFTARSILRGNN